MNLQLALVIIFTSGVLVSAFDKLLKGDDAGKLQIVLLICSIIFDAKANKISFVRSICHFSMSNQ